jgi:hypothetical protein
MGCASAEGAIAAARNAALLSNANLVIDSLQSFAPGSALLIARLSFQSWYSRTPELRPRGSITKKRLSRRALECRLDGALAPRQLRRRSKLVPKWNVRLARGGRRRIRVICRHPICAGDGSGLAHTRLIRGKKTVAEGPIHTSYPLEITGAGVRGSKPGEALASRHWRPIARNA